MKTKILQREIIGLHLRRFGSISRKQAMHYYHCESLSSCITELRAEGWNIETIQAEKRRNTVYKHKPKSVKWKIVKFRK